MARRSASYEPDTIYLRSKAGVRIAGAKTLGALRAVARTNAAFPMPAIFLLPPVKHLLTFSSLNMSFAKILRHYKEQAFIHHVLTFEAFDERCPKILHSLCTPVLWAAADYQQLTAKTRDEIYDTVGPASL